MKKQLKIFRIMKVRNITAMALTMATVSLSGAQGIDEIRMERDLEVAENILATLIKNDKTELLTYYRRSPFHGSYVEGYGVIFSASRDHSTLFIATGSARAYSISRSSGGVAITSDDHHAINVDSLKKLRDESWLKNMKTFLVDYADLIGQLRPEDKVMITTGYSDTGRHWDLRGSARDKSLESTSGTSLEISKKDLTDLKQGKVSRDQALKRIKVVNSSPAEVVEQDIELLASIFERLYKSDLSTTYYLSGDIRYNRIPEFGVIYSMRVYSSTIDDNGLYRIITRNEEGLEKEERNEKIKGFYPDFLSELKRNIVQYGRTLNSLKNEEMLMFKVRLTKCESCGIPESIELSVKASDLEGYDSGRLSESAAIDMITVKEIGTQ